MQSSVKKEDIVKIATTYITMGSKLYTEYVKKEYLKDYPNFRTYVKSEYKDVTYTLAKYSMDIFRMFQRSELSLVDVDDIPWTRVEMLRHVLNKYNKKEYLIAARTYSDADYYRKIKGHKKPQRRLTTGKRTLFIQCETEEHYHFLKEKLEEIKKNIGANTYAKALDYLVSQQAVYLDGLSLDALLEHIEQRYSNVILTVEEF